MLVWREGCSGLLLKHFKNDPDERHKNSKSTSLERSFRVFWQVFIVGRMKTFKSDQMRCLVGFLKVNCSFTLKRSFKLTPNWQKNQISAVVGKICNFLIEKLFKEAWRKFWKKKTYNFIGKIIVEFTWNNRNIRKIFFSKLYHYFFGNFSWSVSSGMGWHFSEGVKIFHQTSVRFHSAMATLEPQKYVVARTVWTWNIVLVSGRLVLQLFKIARQILKYFWAMPETKSFFSRSFSSEEAFYENVFFSRQANWQISSSLDTLLPWHSW